MYPLHAQLLLWLMCSVIGVILTGVDVLPCWCAFCEYRVYCHSWYSCWIWYKHVQGVCCLSPI